VCGEFTDDIAETPKPKNNKQWIVIPSGIY
jgi:hypothetical protein